MATSVVNTAGFIAGYVEPVTGVVTFPVTVTPATESLELAWDAVEGATGYAVYCGIIMGQLLPVALLLSDATAYTVSGLRAVQQYFVQVTAILGPNHSLASVDGDAIPTELTPYAPLASDCTPLSGDVCFMAGNQPRTEENDVSGSVGYTIDWSDDSVCGFDISGALDAGYIATITHTNIAVNQRKSRKVTLTAQWTETSPAVQVISSPVPSGDAMPDVGAGAWDWALVTIVFTSDCAGALSAVVAYIPQ